MNARNGRRRVLVIGGGIGGLTTAIALAGRGDDVEVAELNKDWASAGWGLSLTGPALRALDVVGLADRCLAEGHPVSRIHNCDSVGELMDTNELPPLLGPGRPVQAGLGRPVLHRILRDEATARGATLRCGLTVDGLAQDPEGVTARLTDGGERRFDLVVGADGIRSTVRGLLSLPAKAEYIGQMVWRAVVPRPEWVTELYTFAGHEFNTGVIPISRDGAYIFLTEDSDEPSAHPQDELADRMRELMSEFGGRVASLRALITDPRDVVSRPVHTCLVDGPWHNGRVVVIGDAAHAPSPNMVSGAALAIEDGIVLGEELDRHQDIEAALEAFGRRRLERCRLLVESSVQVAALMRENRHAEAHLLQVDCHRAMAQPA